MSYQEWTDSAEEIRSPRGAGEGSQGTPPAARVLQNLLRVYKRSWKALALATIVTVPLLSYAGWISGYQEYSSTGVIHIKPVLTVILEKTDDNGIPPLFDSFIETNMNLLRSRRVVDMAIQNPKWEQAYGKATNGNILRYINAISVARKGETISATVVDQDPTVAQIGASALIQAFKVIKAEQERGEDEDRLRALMSRQTALKNDIAKQRGDISRIAQIYGTEDLDPFVKTKQEQAAKLELEIQALKILQVAPGASTQPAAAATTAGGSTAGSEGGGAPATTVEAKAESVSAALAQKVLTPEDAAKDDAALFNILARKHQAETEESTLIAGGMGDNNPAIKRVRAKIATADKEANERFEELKRDGKLTVVQQQHEVLAAAATPAEKIKRLQEMLDLVKNEMLVDGRQALQIADYRREEDRFQKDLDAVMARIDHLNVENMSQTQGRFEIMSEGELPLEPSKDKRVQRGALGAFGAMFLSFGIVGLRGLMDRRVKSLEDARPIASSPVLGVLPEIPDGLEDPDLASQAAHNVHHIRTMLEVWSGGRTPLSLTVTSPSSGSGKTSLTLALGVSFAAAGLRTLLVDMDLIGGGLTSRIEGMSRRRLGSVLVAKGILNDVQRAEALRASAASGKRLGETCVALGFTTLEQVESALREQLGNGDLRGVLDVLDGAPIAECIVQTQIPSLFSLTLGNADVAQAGAISPQLVKRMVSRLGQEFDVILIDSGPTPGSLEAAACAISTDGVLLAVARGEDRPALKQCTDHLARIGATMAGVVFNRATMREVLRMSTSRTSSVSASRPRLSQRLDIGTSVEVTIEDANNTGTTTRMGPVASAVATNVRPNRPQRPSNG